MTTERAVVSGHYAGAFSRLAAFVVDWLFILASYTIIAASVQLVLDIFGERDTLTVGVWGIGLAVWALLYLWVALAVTGRSLGKGLLGLRVVDRRGEPLSAFRAALRVLALPLSLAFVGLGFIGVVLGRERRALHDVIAGSTVVYDWGDRPAEMPAPLTRWLDRRGVLNADTAVSQLAGADD